MQFGSGFIVHDRSVPEPSDPLSGMIGRERTPPSGADYVQFPHRCQGCNPRVQAIAAARDAGSNLVLDRFGTRWPSAAVRIGVGGEPVPQLGWNAEQHLITLNRL